MNGLGLERKQSRYIGDRQHSMNDGMTERRERERIEGRRGRAKARWMGRREDGQTNGGRSRGLTKEEQSEGRREGGMVGLVEIEIV